MLTDADLTVIYKKANGEDTGKPQPLTTQRIFKAMRAIESAACEERDARIAELTRELEEARSKAAELERDAIRFRFANDSQEEFAICYWHEDEDGGDWWCDGPRGCAIELLDAAIDAAIKEQT